MDDVLASTFRDSIADHLAYVDRLVDEGNLPCRLAVAEGEIHRLTNTVRGLLDVHEPDPRTGSCPVCSTWFRRRRCSILTTAHRYLLGEDPTTSRSRGRHARSI